MSGSLQLGPWALPLGPLVLGIAAFIGLAVGRRAGRGADADPEPALMRMLLIGLVAARVAFVWRWRDAYLADPVSIFNIRDGGWDPALGTAAAALYVIAVSRRRPPVRRALWAGALTTLVLWMTGAIGLWTLDSAKAPMPALEFSALEGGRVPLRSFIGKPAVVNLWATWCPPCRREMPLLQRAQAEHPELNFVFINQGETADDVHRYLQQQHLALDHVLLDPAMRAGAAFDRRGLPSTLFFDAQGRLVGSHLGELSAATLAQRMQRAQGGPANAATPR